MLYVIEMRSGGYLQSAEADSSGPAASAHRFATQEQAERFMDEHVWILFAGGMAVPDPAPGGSAEDDGR